jgi:hypothetical protein
MISFRSMGARILPSLLSLLPQTEIYREWAHKAPLEFCPSLMPEFVLTGHEICRGVDVILPEKYDTYFQMIAENPDIFPGFFLFDVKNNIIPKLDILRQFGFYPTLKDAPKDIEADSCGAHSPRIAAQAFDQSVNHR